MTRTPLVALEDIHIPTPCSVPLNGRDGDRTRHCDTCAQPVHDLREYTRCQADQLMAADTPPCMIVTRTAAGRVMTLETNPRRFRWRAVRWAALAWALMLQVFGSGCQRDKGAMPTYPSQRTQPPATVAPTPPAER